LFRRRAAESSAERWQSYGMQILVGGGVQLPPFAHLPDAQLALVVQHAPGGAPEAWACAEGAAIEMIAGTGRAAKPIRLTGLRRDMRVS